MGALLRNFRFLFLRFRLRVSSAPRVCGGRRDGHGDWVAASLPPSCGTGNEEKRKREVSQDDVAMATSWSSERWFLLLEIPRAPHEGQTKRERVKGDFVLGNKWAFRGFFRLFFSGTYNFILYYGVQQRRR